MPAQLEDITHTIQLAVAPVFLLTAIGTALGVFAARLGRVVDRARAIENQLDTHGDSQGHGQNLLFEELRRLDTRARLIHFALTMGTVAALLVCLLIATAFVGYLLSVNLGVMVALVFILAVLAFMAALLFFLREIFLAIAMLRFRYPPEVAHAVATPEKSPAS
jgi:hypothetical protein